MLRVRGKDRTKRGSHENTLISVTVDGEPGEEEGGECLSCMRPWGRRAGVGTMTGLDRVALSLINCVTVSVLPAPESRYCPEALAR